MNYIMFYNNFFAFIIVITLVENRFADEQKSGKVLSRNKRVVEIGKCPYIETMENFQANWYMGKWYEIQKYPFIFEAFQKCITAEYTLNSNGTVTVVNTGILKFLNHPISITGLATPRADNPSNLTVSFMGFGNGNYWIIDTDYINYSLVYSCVNNPILPVIIENAWILGRTKTLDPQLIEILKSKLEGSLTILFTPTIQNCNN